MSRDNQREFLNSIALFMSGMQATKPAVDLVVRENEMMSGMRAEDPERARSWFAGQSRQFEELSSTYSRMAQALARCGELIADGEKGNE